MDWPFLSLLILVPLVGAFIIFLIGDQEQNARAVAMWASLVTFALSLLLWAGFDGTTADFQFVERREWIPSLGVSYYVGVDGISVLFVVLSSFLVPVCVLASWTSITKHVKEYEDAVGPITLPDQVYAAWDLEGAGEGEHGNAAG